MTKDPEVRLQDILTGNWLAPGPSAFSKWGKSIYSSALSFSSSLLPGDALTSCQLAIAEEMQLLELFSLAVQSAYTSVAFIRQQSLDILQPLLLDKHGVKFLENNRYVGVIDLAKRLQLITYNHKSAPAQPDEALSFDYACLLSSHREIKANHNVNAALMFLELGFISLAAFLPRSTNVQYWIPEPGSILHLDGLQAQLKDFDKLISDEDADLKIENIVTAGIYDLVQVLGRLFSSMPDYSRSRLGILYARTFSRLLEARSAAYLPADDYSTASLNIYFSSLRRESLANTLPNRSLIDVYAADPPTSNVGEEIEVLEDTFRLVGSSLNREEGDGSGGPGGSARGRDNGSHLQGR